MTITEPAKTQSRTEEIVQEHRRRKQTLERAKANHLMRQLQMRLQYARLKVENGWQRQTLNEVENLYFHQSSAAKPIQTNTGNGSSAQTQLKVAHLAAPPVLMYPPVTQDADTKTEALPASKPYMMGVVQRASPQSVSDTLLDPQLLQDGSISSVRDETASSSGITPASKPPTNPSMPSVPNLNPNLNLPPYNNSQNNLSPQTEELRLSHSQPISTLQPAPALLAAHQNHIPQLVNHEPVPAPRSLSLLSRTAPSTPTEDLSHSRDSTSASTDTSGTSSFSEAKPSQDSSHPLAMPTTNLTYDSFWSGFRGSLMAMPSSMSNASPQLQTPSFASSVASFGKMQNTGTFQLDMASGIAHNLGLGNINVGMGIGQ